MSRFEPLQFPRKDNKVYAEFFRFHRFRNFMQITQIMHLLLQSPPSSTHQLPLPAAGLRATEEEEEGLRGGVMVDPPGRERSSSAPSWHEIVPAGCYNRSDS